MRFRELDVVRVTRLLTTTRPVDGSSGVARQPRVGDVGAVVHVLGDKTFVVECVEAAGLTAWVADFDAGELALVSRRRRYVLAGDVEVRARLEPIIDLLEHICGQEEFPSFVSDLASVYDVCSLDEGELMRRIAALYGPRVGPAELRLPIWKLVDVLAVRTLAPEDPG